MPDLKKSLFVLRAEFYFVVALILILIARIGSEIERINSSLSSFVLSELPFAMGMFFALVAIVSAVKARSFKERSQ